MTMVFVLNFETFSSKFPNRTHFLRYCGIINTIKNALSKEQLFQDINLFNSPVIDFDTNILSGSTGACINSSIAKSKEYYIMLINSKKKRPCGTGNWIRNYDVDEHVLFHSLSLCKVCIKESKLLSMQFKIVHNIINRGVNLKKGG